MACSCQDKDEFYEPIRISKIVKIQNGWIVHSGDSILNTQLFRTTSELREFIAVYADGEVKECMMCNNIRIGKVRMEAPKKWKDLRIGKH